MNHSKSDTTADRTLWAALKQSAEAAQSQSIDARFTADADRASSFSSELGPLFIDYSKHPIDDVIRQQLTDLADSSKLGDKLTALRRGDAINNTEGRSANYPLLRQQGHSGDPAIDKMHRDTAAISEQILNGGWTSSDGSAFSDIVNIGIGGSDLGPRLLCDALPNHSGLHCHFIANVDPNEISALLEKLPAQQTLFIIASKSFSTSETLANAHSAQQWLEQQLPGADHHRHFMAITAKPQAAIDHGVSADRILQIPEWIGGRFSIWSGFALSVVLHAGLDTYRAFLQGGRGVDEHVSSNALGSNVPLLLGLLDVWYRNSWLLSSHAVLPYDHRLKLLPNYLQQLFMESAGKSVSSDGSPLQRNSGGVIWGTEGSNGQHSFHQLLHQGSDTIPCDFIVAMSSPCRQTEQHQALVANCLSQSLVLMRGQSKEEIYRQLLAEGSSPDEAELLARHKAMPGNRPSTTITMAALTAESLGALIALYEYRLLTQSFVWGINPFDQWGVELGKKISGEILKAMNSGDDENLDGSSKLLLSRYREQLHNEAKT